MNAINKINKTLIILFPVLLISVDNLDPFILLSLLILSSIILIKDRSVLPLTYAEKLFIYIVSIFILVYIFNDFYFNLNYSNLDDPLPFLLLLPLFFYFRKNTISLKQLLFSIFIGSLCCIVFAVYQKYFLNISRAQAGVGITTFGAISMSLALVSIPAIVFYKSYLIKGLMSLSFIFALSASILSGTRGAWISLPISIIIVLIINPNNYRKRTILTILLFLALIISGLYLIPLVQLRMDTALSNINDYYYHNNYGSSLGLRLEVWRITITAFFENPIIGIGIDYPSFYQEYIKVNNLPEGSISALNHVHNDFISAAFHRGLLGFISLLFVFFLPFYYFIRSIKQSTSEDLIVPLMGVLFITNFTVTSMSDELFGQHELALFFVFYLYLFFTHLNIGNKET